MKKKVLIVVLIFFTMAVMFALLLFSARTAGLRSDLALQIQGTSFIGASVFNQAGLQLDIPTARDYGGSGWCKNMKLFDADDVFFDHGVGGEMSILYNFGRFQNGRATFYDPASDYFNAHYGIYAIRRENDVFGWEDGKLDVAEIVKIVAFDQEELVMASLGCPRSKCHFDYEITGIKEDLSMSGFSDWTQIDANIDTNAPLHHQTKNLIGYLQYGEPPKDYVGEDFPVVTMKGRLYLRYDDERDTTVIYFVIGKSQNLIDQTSTDYLLPIRWN